MWNNFIKITDFSPAFMSDMFMTRKFNRKRFSLSIFILLGKIFFFLKASWIKAFHLIFTVFALNSLQRPKSEARSIVDAVHMWESRWANVSREEKWSCSHIRLTHSYFQISIVCDKTMYLNVISKKKKLKIYILNIHRKKISFTFTLQWLAVPSVNRPQASSETVQL